MAIVKEVIPAILKCLGVFHRMQTLKRGLVCRIRPLQACFTDSSNISFLHYQSLFHKGVFKLPLEKKPSRCIGSTSFYRHFSIYLWKQKNNISNLKKTKRRKLSVGKQKLQTALAPEKTHEAEQQPTCLSTKFLSQKAKKNSAFVILELDRQIKFRVPVCPNKKDSTLLWDLLHKIFMASSVKRKRDTPKFYAVRSGHQTGVFATWEECKAQTAGYSGAVCTFISGLGVSPCIREAFHP